MNILEKANDIINNRSEEKERMYGNFDEGMEKAAEILTALTGQQFDAIIMYKAMIALKLSREYFHHKEDNLLDAVAYIGGWNNYINNINNRNYKNYILDYLNDYIKRWDNLSIDNNKYEELTKEYVIFTSKHKLPDMSADELILKIKNNEI